MSGSAAARLFALLAAAVSLPLACGVRDSFDVSTALESEEVPPLRWFRSWKARKGKGYVTTSTKGYVTTSTVPEYVTVKANASQMSHFSWGKGSGEDVYFVQMHTLGVDFGRKGMVSEVERGKPADVAGIRVGWKLERLYVATLGPTDRSVEIKSGGDIYRILVKLQKKKNVGEVKMTFSTDLDSESVWEFEETLRDASESLEEDEEEEEEELYDLETQARIWPVRKHRERPGPAARGVRREFQRRLELEPAEAREARRALEHARSNYGDAQDLRGAIRRAEAQVAQGLLTDKDLEAAWTTLKRLEDRSEARSEARLALKEAASTKDVDRLRSAISAAQQLLLPDSDLDPAREALRLAISEAETKVRRDLSEAVAMGSTRELRALILVAEKLLPKQEIDQCWRIVQRMEELGLARRELFVAERYEEGDMLRAATARAEALLLLDPELGGFADELQARLAAADEVRLVAGGEWRQRLLAGNESLRDTLVIEEDELQDCREALQRVEARENGEHLISITKLDVVTGKKASRLGMVVKANGRGLKVHSIEKGGLVANHNNRSLQSKMPVGSIITVVNGRKGDPAAMKRELREADEVVISFWRCREHVLRIEERRPEQSLGLGVEASGRELKVVSIEKDGLVANENRWKYDPELRMRVGDRITAVNDVAAVYQAADPKAMIRALDDARTPQVTISFTRDVVAGTSTTPDTPERGASQLELPRSTRASRGAAWPPRR